jgi:hypothetical protein
MKQLLLALFFVVLIVPLSFAKMNGSATVQKSFNYTQADPDSGGPDQWGYTWKRSDEPGGPVFNWLDSANGWHTVDGLQDDNSVGYYDFGFDFNFYWYKSNKVLIGSNGWVSMSAPIGANLAAAFTQFPNATAPNDIVAPLAADFDYSIASVQGSKCYFWTNNTDSAIVSWVDAVEWYQTPPAQYPKYSFQVIFCKTDSSITFQYGNVSSGANFASESNISMGIENVVGNIGLSYYFVDGSAGGTVDPTRYATGTAVKIARTVNTGFQVVDAGMVGGFNAGNAAVFLQSQSANNVTCYVQNFGTADLTNVRVRHAITRGATTVLRDTVFIAYLLQGAQEMVTFPKTFTPSQAGIHSSRFTVDATGDVLATNNAQTTETNVLNFAGGSNVELAYDDGALDGTGRSWGSAGGFGNEFELPITVDLESAYVRIQTVGSGALTVMALGDDGPNGTPGTVLATKEIAAPIAGLNKVYFGSDNINIGTGHKFYIGATGQHTYAMDQSTPRCNRGWEITAGWGSNRFGATEDVMIRATVNVMTGVVDELSYLQKGYELEQNFPNPFNPTTNISFSIAQRSNVSIKIFDILGSEIQTLINGIVESGNHSIVWEGTNSKGISVPSGMYFYQLNVNGISVTKKMVLMK